MARDRARRRATRRAVGKGAVRRLRRGPADRRGRSARRRAHRLSRLRTRDARRQAAGQAVAAPVRRGYRTGTRRALVGLGRPRAGAFRFGLRPGEPLGRFPGLPVPLSRDERRAARAVLPRIARRAEGERRALGAADRNIDAGSVERHLFRAGLSRALSRLSLGGGRGSRDAGRPRVRAHDRRPQARRCALAPRRRRMVRSARAQLGLAYRSAGAAGRDPRRRRRGREHAGLWTRGSARAAAVPAETRAAPARRGPRDAEHRDLVVRAARGARARARRARDRVGGRRVRRRRAGLRRAAERGRRRTQCERAREASRGDRDARRRLRRSGHRAPFDDAALGARPAGPAPIRASRLRRRDARGVARHARRICPCFRQERRARRLHDRRRRVGRRLGAGGQSRRDDEPAAHPGKSAHRPHARQPAEPRGRQSLLVWPLSRT